MRKAFCNDFINFIQSLVKEDEHLVPIPVDQGTIKVRGFNQVTGLIEGLEFEPVLISQRSEQARHQFQRSRRERLQRENPFRVVEPNKVAGAKWVIIDDIYTTGVTVRQAGRELSKHGARQVRSITLCR
ncbi:ComF family protein [Pediococcus acidilactici]|nr:ComF family protein [Pediococcus acidilactici]KAF0337728.1 ComF family protein [Pediococcus acidilactici]KAF0339166.1 ComF family protein [Pediococcus acidilactici]KAF0345084.1 ComF family protein [Pediococcus acidilactici]KAF0348403.1 ComF family protein [Pediococcus acidilactici]